MSRLKVLTIVGTRPELIKLSRVIAELSSVTDHVLVHTGQNFDYELNEIFFQELSIERPRHFLEAAGTSPIETVARVLSRIDPILETERPDAVLILGDTNSSVAAYAAKRRRIPIFHMEAGNRGFDQRVPEEINRKLVDHLSDVNLPYTEHARRYLLAEGLPPELIIKTGSPMREVLRHYWPLVEASPILSQQQVQPGQFFVVSCHREENVDQPARLARLVEILARLAREFEWPVIVSTHPRTRKRLEEFPGEPSANEDVRFLKPLGFPDYVQLQRQAACVLSDSGTLTEEASLCNFPAVMLRQTHERPEGMDEAVVVLADLNPDRVLEAVRLVRRHAEAAPRASRPVGDYEADNVSRKVARLILSYTDYVKRTVWHE